MQSTAESRQYWEGRHAALKLYRAGGDKSLTEDANQVFYQIRLAKIRVLIYRRFGSARRLRILDAGCGAGWMAAELARTGYRVLGIDMAESAVRRARQTFGIEARVASLHEYTSHESFHVILLQDVLFHVVDDEQWRQSLVNLASLLTGDGALIFADELRAQRYTLSNYIVHRSLTEYEQVLGALGMRLECVDTYGVFGNLNHIYMATWS